MSFTSYDKTQQVLQESFKDAFLRLKKKVPLEQSIGLILANDIKTKYESPRYPTASMDGYAIIFEDQTKEKIKISSILPAGTSNTQILKSGECIKTFTGSLMSDGSDTLIPIENVEVKDGYIIVKKSVEKGYANRKVGENYLANEVLIKKFAKITYAEIGILAELGYANVEVISPPRVGVIATGNEIVDIGEELENKAQIRSSNHILLSSLAKHWGAEPIMFSVVKDDKEQIRQSIQRALIHCDIVVTTGGVSVGDYDYVRDVINEYGTKPLINGAAIKPGRHVRILKFNEKYLCSLPGFPLSAAVTFRLYCIPIIQHFLNLDTNINYSYGFLRQKYQRKTKFSEFQSCFVHEERGKTYIDFEGQRAGSSAIINNLLNSAALLVVLENVKGYEQNECVPLIKMLP